MSTIFNLGTLLCRMNQNYSKLREKHQYLRRAAELAVKKPEQ